VHRAASWALIALLPWKALIAVRSLRRGVDRRFNRSVMLGVSLLLAALAVTVLVLGLLWTWRLGPALIAIAGYADTAVSWHWMLALGLLAPLALHVWRRWPRPKAREFTSRRGALKLLGVGAAGVAGWWAAEQLAEARARAEAPRRFTGSVEARSFSGNDFPITHLPGEDRLPLEPETYLLAVRGAVPQPVVMRYAELLAIPAVEQIATLDCTTGWYSTQAWRGVPLIELLAWAGFGGQAAAVRLRGATGYFGDFTVSEASGILLATHVGGEVLAHRHGFPVRAVAPTRRGWFWIKWLTEIEVFGLPGA
jgi:DMSO/TMAO reductase YedYZ molybdopterin-dependent catalytic subunit